MSIELSSRCGKALKELSVKRSPEKINSLYEQFRDIQVTWSVFCTERSKARCIATAIGPPEVNITDCSPGFDCDMNREIPEFTRLQNSVQVSTPGTIRSPVTQSPIILAKSF